MCLLFTLRNNAFILIFLAVFFCQINCTHKHSSEETLQNEQSLPADCAAAIDTLIEQKKVKANPQKAVELFKALTNKYSYSKDSLAHATAMMGLGRAYAFAHKDTARVRSFEESLLYFDSHPSYTKQRITCYHGLAVGYYLTRNNLKTAMYYATKAGIELEQKPLLDTSVFPLREKAFFYYIFGRLATTTEDYAQAEKYTDLNLQLIKRIQAKLGQEAFLCYKEATSTFCRLKKFGKAAKCIQQMEHLVGELGPSPRPLGWLYTQKANYYSGLKQWQQAKDNLRSGLPVFEKDDEHRSLMPMHYKDLAYLYAETQQLDSARYFFKQMQKSMTKPGVNGLDASFRKDMAALSIKMAFLSGDKNRGMTYVDTLTKLDKEFYDKERLAVINDLESRYKLQQKDQNISRLTADQQRYKAELTLRNTLLTGGALLVIVLGFVGWSFQRQRQLKMAKDRAELEQRLLRLQMNPHFMFNVLGSLQSVVRQNDTPVALQYIQHFSRLLRDNLELSRSNLVSLTEELETIRHYLSLQQLLNENSFTYYIQLDEALEPDDICIPPMLIQPFVENAIEHGFQQLTYKGHIDLCIKKNANDQLQIEIEDNGRGFVEKLTPPGYTKRSLATQISQERLQWLYPNQQASIRVENKKPQGSGSGVWVTIVLPLNYVANPDLA